MTIYKEAKTFTTDVDEPLAIPPRAKRGVAERRGLRLCWQIAILVAFLAVWQFAPDWPFLVKHVSFFNRIFISSPVAVVKTLNELLFTGKNNIPFVWPYLRVTVEATVFGCLLDCSLARSWGSYSAIVPHSARLADPSLCWRTQFQESR